jgi:hypothetical protein
VKQFFYVYVPAGAKQNLEIGVAGSIWGWKSAALDNRLKDFYGMQARQLAQDIKPGDYLVLGHLGPNSRVPRGGWSASVLGEAVLTEVTSALHHADNQVWFDETYPERVRMSVLERITDIGGAQLGPEAMEALRLSANVGGVPIPAGSVDVLALQARLEEDTTAEQGDADASDLSLDIDGDTDALAQVIVRREQKKLRRLKFGDHPNLQCDLCGRLVPRRFVRAAHIKRRAVADPNERRNLANFLAACLFGCDELFEHGYLYVDATGRVQINDAGGRHSTADLLAVANGLVDRVCSAATPESAGFFTWHRQWALGVG